jgi:Fe-S-cluster-containing hydrogenase component 2
MRACKAKAIYFEHGIRKVDYIKCKACLNCTIVCPRNAVEITSITSPDQIISIKIDHEKCNLCEQCLDETGNFCPKNLFYKDIVKKVGREEEGIRYRHKEIAKCQGCLKCAVLCPEEAIGPVTFET